jgi:NAD(P)-dependent dehydrogenase (short-subunit alcohol dehydrogenase family)
VIAGGSEGVGASLAVQLGERGVNVVLIARNGEDWNGSLLSSRSGMASKRAHWPLT